MPRRAQQRNGREEEQTSEKMKENLSEKGERSPKSIENPEQV